MHPVEFISAGPGDPGLLTVAGLEALHRCPAVVAPATFQRSFAAELAGRELQSPFQLDWASLVRWIEIRLEQAPVGFLVPGDFSSFCPFQSFVAHFGPRARVTPGVGAHAAAAALLQKTFDLPGIAHAAVLTSPRAFARNGERVRLRDYARPGHTLVVYMNDLPLAELVDELRAGFGADTPVAILEQISCPEERITRGRLSTICDRVGDRDPFGLASAEPEPTLALVIAGDALEADEDPSWWDRRYEKIWKPRGMR
ncbi:MAG: precorrin-4 C(11)-methyltransferase [Deferrisomatales bacterium]